MASAIVKKLTPVLLVEKIEPCLPLWTERLGWIKVTELDHEGALGFVILVKDGVEVMYQSWASVASDVGAGSAPDTGGRASTCLFIEVDDLSEIDRLLGDLPRAVPRRTTFYGMDEVGVKEAGGHIVIFAQPTTVV